MHKTFSDLATRLISKNGRAMTLVSVRNIGPAWDPTQKETEVDIIGLQTKRETDEQETNDLIKSTDICIIVDSTVKPEIGMGLIDDDGVKYSVVYVKHTKPGTRRILSKVFVRR